MERSRRSGLTVVEVVVAGALLVVMVLGIAVVLTQSMRHTRESGISLVAQDAAARVTESLTSMNFAAAFNAFWVNAPKVTIAGKEWAAPDITVAADYTGTPWESCVLPLITEFNRGRMRRPLDGQPNRPLRVRFVNETEYRALWALGGLNQAHADLNFDGTLDSTGSGQVNYATRPYVVEVHWADEGGARRFQVRAVQVNQPGMDPNRGV